MTTEANTAKRPSVFGIAVSVLESMLELTQNTDYSQVPLDVFLRECRTVIAGGGRQNGKTRWIAEHAGSGDLVVCLNDSLKRMLLGYYTVFLPQDLVRPTIITVDSFSETLERDSGKFNKVIVEDASYVFSKLDRDSFYGKIAECCTAETMIYLIG